MSLIIVLVALVVFDVLAMRYGADSRELDIQGLRASSNRAQI